MMRISSNGRSKFNVNGQWHKTAQFQDPGMADHDPNTYDPGDDQALDEYYATNDPKWAQVLVMYENAIDEDYKMTPGQALSHFKQQYAQDLQSGDHGAHSVKRNLQRRLMSEGSEMADQRFDEAHESGMGYQPQLPTDF